MMQRRSFLSAIATLVGGGAAAPAVLTVDRAAAVLGVSRDDTVSDIASVACEPGYTGVTNGEIEAWRLMDMLDQHRRNLGAPEKYLPPHIASKRSWSAAYKASVHAREQLIYDLARAKISANHDTAAGILRRILTGKDDDA